MWEEDFARSKFRQLRAYRLPLGIEPYSSSNGGQHGRPFSFMSNLPIRWAGWCRVCQRGYCSRQRRDEESRASILRGVGSKAIDSEGTHVLGSRAHSISPPPFSLSPAVLRLSLSVFLPQFLTLIFVLVLFPLCRIPASFEVSMKLVCVFVSLG